MGVPLSPAGEALVLEAIAPAAGGVFVSLHTGDPGVTGADELSGNGYARQPATWEDTTTDPTERSNDAEVQFPVATAAWGNITYVGIWDAVSGGNFLAGGALASVKTVGQDDSLRFPVNSLVFTVD